MTNPALPALTDETLDLLARVARRAEKAKAAVRETEARREALRAMPNLRQAITFW